MNKYDKQHQKNLRIIEKQVDALYKQAADQAAQIGVNLRGFNPSKPFSFADSIITQKKAEKLVQWLQSGLMQTISGGIHTGWALSNQKNDSIADSFLGQGVPNILKRQYYNHNGDAEQAFIERVSNGMSLSDRVWRYSNEFKNEMELGLDLGIRTGRSAQQMSRDLRIYLQHPDKLFHDVRTKMKDDEGNPIWRKSHAAEAYHPGRGVYRSSYKNARRLAVTETNMAYRTADHERWQKMDFVIGQHVIRSKHHEKDEVHDICDELSGYDEEDKKGRYPKDFKFTGWHPLCRCYVVPILMDEDEFMDWQEKKANGEDVSSYHFEEEVKKMPKEYTDWYKENAVRITQARQQKTLPMFMKIEDGIENENGIVHAVFQNGEYTIKQSMGFVPNPDFHEVKSFIMDFSQKNPQMFKGKILEVLETDMLREPFLTEKVFNEDGSFKGYVVSILNSPRKANYIIDGKSVLYEWNPSINLSEAIMQARQGRGLLFTQEYSVEALWHEMRHASALGWVDVNLYDGTKAHSVELINQFCARRTYADSLLRVMGTEPWHEKLIIADGMGYRNTLLNFSTLLKDCKIPENAVFEYFKDVIQTSPYEEIEDLLVSFIGQYTGFDEDKIRENVRTMNCIPDRYIRLGR